MAVIPPVIPEIMPTDKAYFERVVELMRANYHEVKSDPRDHGKRQYDDVCEKHGEWWYCVSVAWLRFNKGSDRYKLYKSPAGDCRKWEVPQATPGSREVLAR